MPSVTAMSESPAPTFPPEVVEAIARHMNDDHGEDNVRICRALGGRPDAESAVMTGVDGDGIEFLVDGPDGRAPVRIAWPERISERPQVRTAVVELHDRACAVLGVAPPRGDHG
jgi:putative heme iron utilization protein